MSLNPHMKAFITHGRYDLVTPYYASDRLRNLMRLDPAMAGRLTVRHFGGGHMFYAWEDSRKEFAAAIAEFSPTRPRASRATPCSARPGRAVWKRNPRAGGRGLRHAPVGRLVGFSDQYRVDVWGRDDAFPRSAANAAR